MSYLLKLFVPKADRDIKLKGKYMVVWLIYAALLLLYLAMISLVNRVVYS